MEDKEPILIILKPEIFDPDIRRDHADVFLPGVEFPSPEVFIQDLFEWIISEYEWPFSFVWTEHQIRAQYNQPHHFLFEPWFQKNRVDTLVDIYTGKVAQFYRAHGIIGSPDLLNLRKKEIRKRYLRNPNVAFYSLYHVSDTFEDAQRERLLSMKNIYNKQVEYLLKYFLWKNISFLSRRSWL